MYDQDLIHLVWNEDVLCVCCREQMKKARRSFQIEGLAIESLYVYEGLCRELLIQYKELLDEALYPVFLLHDIKYLRKKYRKYTLVSMPSSKRALDKRGFHHVEQMFGILGLPMVSLFQKEEMEEQKHASIEERKAVRSHIHLLPEVSIPQGPLLLVDDVCTTGNTLLAAYELLKEHSYPVRALVFSCHASYVEIRRWKFVEFLWGRRYTQSNVGKEAMQCKGK